jgi:hypothetical protein
MALNKIEPWEKIALQSLLVGLCTVAVVDWWRDILMGFWLSVAVCFVAAAVFYCVGRSSRPSTRTLARCQRGARSVGRGFNALDPPAIPRRK